MFLYNLHRYLPNLSCGFAAQINIAKPVCVQCSFFGDYTNSIEQATKDARVQDDANSNVSFSGDATEKVDAIICAVSSVVLLFIALIIGYMKCNLINI